jgi:hypothetical protein
MFPNSDCLIGGFLSMIIVCFNRSLVHLLLHVEHKAFLTFFVMSFVSRNYVMNIPFLDRHQIILNIFQINLSLRSGPQFMSPVTLDFPLFDHLVQEKGTTIFPYGTLSRKQSRSDTCSIMLLHEVDIP